MMAISGTARVAFSTGCMTTHELPVVIGLTSFRSTRAACETAKDANVASNDATE